MMRLLQLRKPATWFVLALVTASLLPPSIITTPCSPSLLVSGFSPSSFVHRVKALHLVRSTCLAFHHNDKVCCSRSTSHPFPFDMIQPNPKQQALSSTLTSEGDLTSSTPSDEEVEVSTLTLLEHVNLNVPNHDYILTFYLDLLGFGLDPRRAQNVLKGSGTVWPNCGSSQFHLPFGETAQVIPGHIGLRYDTLAGLKERLVKMASVDDDKQEKCFEEYEIGTEEKSGKEYVKIVDRYGNTFFCREGQPGPEDIGIPGTDEFSKIKLRQPILCKDDTEHLEKFDWVATRYGKSKSATSAATTTTTTKTTTTTEEEDQTGCRGIDYVEFNVPRNTAERIATFYEHVLDATTSVVTDEKSKDTIAIVGFGSIDKVSGKPTQSLLFRETDEEIPPYDGHHVALYVGRNRADFEQAFKNCEQAGIVWVNPRFSDKASNLNAAKKWKQFRFKDIFDLRNGKKIFELEHEMRSVEHDAWPGK